MNHSKYFTKLFLLLTFAVAMAYLEASVVVYLRELFYPEGFAFPIKTIPSNLKKVEFVREAMSILMLIVMAMALGKKYWEKFGYLITLFGIWDIFYYVWLKVLINWPLTLFDWDILFLIPVTWISPVLAPGLIALFMLIFGVVVTYLYERGFTYRPGWLSWLSAILGTGLILFSFLRDYQAGYNQQMPRPYLFSLLAAGLFFYGFGFIFSLIRTFKTPTRYS